MIGINYAVVTCSRRPQCDFVVLAKWLNKSNVQKGAIIIDEPAHNILLALWAADCASSLKAKLLVN